MKILSNFNYYDLAYAFRFEKTKLDLSKYLFRLQIQMQKPFRQILNYLSYDQHAFMTKRIRKKTLKNKTFHLVFQKSYNSIFHSILLPLQQEIKIKEIKKQTNNYYSAITILCPHTFLLNYILGCEIIIVANCNYAGNYIVSQ